MVQSKPPAQYSCIGEVMSGRIKPSRWPASIKYITHFEVGAPEEWYVACGDRKNCPHLLAIQQSTVPVETRAGRKCVITFHPIRHGERCYTGTIVTIQAL